MADRLSRLLAGLAALIGVGALLVGLSVFVEAWQASRARADPMLQAQSTLPADEAPVWLDAPPATPIIAVSASAPAAAGENPPLLEVGAPAPHSGAELATEVTHLAPRRAGGDIGSADGRAVQQNWGSDAFPSRNQGEAPVARQGDVATPAPAAPALASPVDIDLVEVEFRFLTPPEPGAHARLAVTLQNQADAESGPVSLVLSQRWLSAFSVFGAAPDVLDDRPAGDAERRFEFPGLHPQERRTVELHMLATAEEVDAPEVRVLLASVPSDVGVSDAQDGDAELGEIGRVQPRTVAPRPRPGPARSVIVPKLGVRAPVVPVVWEPPQFVVGQVLGSAHVSEGNTVLIGHLAGPLGDVFSRLSQLRPGDEVTATSRGLEYRFVVSEMSVRPYDDISPTEPTTTPRLTLMTCTGQWSVLRQDYSHRLWVVAEPPELAQETIRANTVRAEETAREADAAAAARATHEAEVNAQTSQSQPGQPQSGEVAVEPASQGVPPLVVVTPSGASPAAVASPAAGQITEPMAPGLLIEAPAQDERVPYRLIVSGRRTEEANVSAPVWLLVRADLEGSRWYALPQPLMPEKGGRWQAELELGGGAGIRHEIRVGVADTEADTLLRRHATERPGQPLDTLPGGFVTGARVTVERR